MLPPTANVQLPKRVRASTHIIVTGSTSDAFIAANIGNFKYGPKLAFMVFGPMMDAKLVFLYSTVFRWKFILFLCLGLFVGAGALSLFFEHVIGANWNQGVTP